MQGCIVQGRRQIMLVYLSASIADRVVTLWRCSIGSPCHRAIFGHDGRPAKNALQSLPLTSSPLESTLNALPPPRTFLCPRVDVLVRAVKVGTISLLGRMVPKTRFRPAASVRLRGTPAPWRGDPECGDRTSLSLSISDLLASALIVSRLVLLGRALALFGRDSHLLDLASDGSETALLATPFLLLLHVQYHLHLRIQEFLRNSIGNTHRARFHALVGPASGSMDKMEPLEIGREHVAIFFLVLVERDFALPFHQLNLHLDAVRLKEIHYAMQIRLSIEADLQGQGICIGEPVVDAGCRDAFKEVTPTEFWM